MTTSERERRLMAVLERCVSAMRQAEAVMRAGSCPKCGEQPRDADGGFDEEFALLMCSTEDWMDIHDALAAAESEVATCQLDVYRPARSRLPELEAALVELDASWQQGCAP